MLIGLLRGVPGARVRWLQHPSLLWENAGQANSVSSAKLDRPGRDSEMFEARRRSHPGVPVSSRACGCVGPGVDVCNSPRALESWPLCDLGLIKRQQSHRDLCFWADLPARG